MLSALRELGIRYQLSDDKTECIVEGQGKPISGFKGIELFLGNAGTAMRPLTAALCLGDNDITLTGEPRMKERPIGHLTDALRQGGAQIDFPENDGYPPLRIRGGFTGGRISVDGSVSSQFLTALLMAAPPAENDTEITISGELVSKPYIDITLAMMSSFGITVVNEDYRRFLIKGKQQYQSLVNIWWKGMRHPPPISSRRQPLKAAQCGLPASDVTVCRVTRNLRQCWKKWARK